MAKSWPTGPAHHQVQPSDLGLLERTTGFEPATLTLAKNKSNETDPLRPHGSGFLRVRPLRIRYVRPYSRAVYYEQRSLPA